MSDRASEVGRDWLEIVRRTTFEEFAKAFTPDAVLEATVLDARLAGAAGIYKFFRATRSMYESIAFVQETRAGSRTCLEWAGVFHGRAVSGATILACDSHGAIEHIRLFHHPRDQLAEFAVELKSRLAQAGHAPIHHTGDAHEDDR